MPQTQNLLLLIGCFQGILLFVLLVSNKRVNHASKLLGLQCLFIATTLALPIIVAAGDSYFSWLIGFLLFLPACYGALMYLYCRTAITDSPLKYGDILHFMPLAVCYLLNYDILFSPERALSFVRMSETPLFRHQLTKAIFYGQSIVYAGLLIRMVSRYQTKARQTLSSYNPDIFKWLWSLTSFTVSIWSLKILFVLNSWAPFFNMLADCLLVVTIYFVAITQWRNPNLFYIPQLTSTDAKPQAPSDKQASDGLLDEATRETIFRTVKSQVKDQALYRNSELTLAMLAGQVGVNVHHLSEALNQYGGKNFNLFINEYRVAEVCQQLDQKSERKIIDIALDAGFSSKSSFNAIFKKVTGQAPSLYRRQ